jgi:hypothetical protein
VSQNGEAVGPRPDEGKSAGDRLSAEKHCELLSANVRERSASIYEGFKLFVQLFSALVGGAVIIRLQYPKDLPSSFATLSNGLAVLITGASALLVLNAFFSWWGQRKRLSEVAGKDEIGNAIIPPPRIGLGQASVRDHGCRYGERVHPILVL